MYHRGLFGGIVLVAGLTGAIGCTAPQKIDSAAHDAVKKNYEAFKAEIADWGYQLKQDDFRPGSDWVPGFYFLGTKEVAKEDGKDGSKSFKSTITVTQTGTANMDIQFLFKKRVFMRSDSRREVTLESGWTGYWGGWDDNWRNSGDLKVQFLNGVRKRLGLPTGDYEGGLEIPVK